MDKPGVLAQISTILSKHHISIESLIQKDASQGQVPIVLITNVVVEQSLVDALADLHSLDDVLNEIAFIRVAAF